MKSFSGSPERFPVWLALLVVSLSLPSLTAASSTDSWAGREVEVPALRTLSGDTVTFPPEAGSSILLLNFSATWCGPCRKEWPILDEFYRETKPENVSVLVVDVGESEETVHDFWKKEGFELPVTVEEEKLREQLNVSAYPTNVILGPYGRVIFRDEGFDEGITDVVKSYAPEFRGAPLRGGSPMVPEKLRERASPSQDSRTRPSPELNLSGDSPVKALESLNRQRTLSELGNGLSDTFLRKINPSLYSLLETMKKRNRHQAAYASFRSGNPEAARIVSNYAASDSPVHPRSAYRSITVALEALNRELVSSLADLVLIQYKFVSQWEPRKIDDDRYRFEESWGARSFEVYRRKDRWRFDFPFQPAVFGEKKELENLRFLGETAERRLNAGVPPSLGDWAYVDRFGYRLEEDENQYTFSALVPSLVGFEDHEGREVNESLYEKNYLSIKSLTADASSGDTVALSDQETYDHTFHRERGGMVLGESDWTFELPEGMGLSDVVRLRGTLGTTVPRDTRSGTISLDAPYRSGEAGGHEFEAVRLGARGLVIRFEEEPSRLWSLSALSNRGEPVGFRSMIGEDWAFTVSLDEPVSFLKFVRAEGTDRKTFPFSVPVRRKTHTLKLREGNELTLSEGRIRIEKVASTGQGSNRTVHVKLSFTTEDDHLEALRGLTRDGSERTPEVLTGFGPPKEPGDQQKLLRFDGPVRSLRIDLKGTTREGL